MDAVALVGVEPLQTQASGLLRLSTLGVFRILFVHSLDFDQPSSFKNQDDASDLISQKAHTHLLGKPKGSLVSF